jgi:hypothetical protein
MALGSTHPQTEMSTRSLPGDKGRPAHKVDLIVISERIVLPPDVISLQLRTPELLGI